MDSECLVLLPRVCAVLVDPRQSLPDDTSLEKLLDWFTDHGLALLESCPCLVDYISTVCLDKTTDPSMLSFSLKLSGLLAASQHGFNLLQDRSILSVAYDSERWQVAGLWEDPSVRIGWIHGLSNMMRHTQAFYFLDQAGLTKPLLQLQTDPSLFVASAANHLLARLLTFHQPATTSHTTQGNGLTVPPNKEEVELAVLQGLRLLAMTLPKLEAPLWGWVIRRVLRPLEGLVLEGRRAITQPLMDVLLATYRCVCPPGLRQKVVAVLLGPLQMVTGVTLLNWPNDRRTDQQTDHRHTDQQTDHRHTDQQTDHRHTDEDNRQTDTDQDRQTEGRSSLSLLLDHLNQKPSCISLLCVSESSASVILAVVSLLRICNGHSPSPESKAAIGCSKAFTNLIGCSKVQRCGLDSLASLSTCPGENLESGVFHVLVQNLQNPDSDPTIFILTFFTVCACMYVVTDLLPVLKKRVCDVRWEVRDSTVEFLGQLCVCEALSCAVTPILLEALFDQESYVRASAISALARTLPLPLSDQQGEPGNRTQVRLTYTEHLLYNGQGSLYRIKLFQNMHPVCNKALK
uniref:Uncharacterized protein n=1 Tax=Hucho hucho TaxID=62062 RepID=A0A4W5L2X2_9TELE